MKILAQILILSVLAFSCNSEKEAKYYNEIKGLWQPKNHPDSSYSWGGCSEYYGNGNWRVHAGCTEEHGEYWFDEDTLYRTLFSYEKTDTIKHLVLELQDGELITYSFDYKDTTYHRRVSWGDGVCFEFDDW